MAPAQGGTLNQAIGRSRGGLTTKIAALVDGLGNLVRFVLLPGQRHDINSVDDLLAGIACEALIGDKAFDAKALRERLADHRIEAVIPEPRRGCGGLRLRPRKVPMAPSGRELLLPDQGRPTHRHTLQENRHML